MNAANKKDCAAYGKRAASWMKKNKAAAIAAAVPAILCGGLVLAKAGDHLEKRFANGRQLAEAEKAYSLQQAKLSLLELRDGDAEALRRHAGLEEAVRTYLDPEAFDRECDKVVDSLMMPSRREARLANEELGLGRDPLEYPRTARLMKEEIGLDAAKAELAALRIAGNDAALAAAEKRFCANLLAALRKFFPADKYTEDEKKRKVSRSMATGLGKDAGFLATKRVICLGRSMTAHAFLRAAGVAHRTLDLPGHSAVTADLADRTQFLLDPNYGDLVSLAASPVVNGRKAVIVNEFLLGPSAKLGRAVDAGLGIRAHELNNLATQFQEDDAAHDRLLKLATDLYGVTPGSTPTANRLAAVEENIRKQAEEILKKDPSTKFYGADWEAMAGLKGPAPKPKSPDAEPFLVPIRAMRVPDPLANDRLPGGTREFPKPA